MCFRNAYESRGGADFASKMHGGFGGPWAHRHSPRREGWFQPPVNIEDLGDRYELHLAAPGRLKSDFQINVQGEVLAVSCRRQEDSDLGKQPNWLRREFQTAPFERQFALHDKIDASSLHARYTDGVLVVTLPKTAGAQTPAQEVYVA